MKLERYISIFNERYDEFDEIFARKRRDGNYDILYTTDGTPVTTIDAKGVYPVDSSLGVSYEHPEGIILSKKDVMKLGIEIE